MKVPRAQKWSTVSKIRLLMRSHPSPQPRQKQKRRHHTCLARTTQQTKTVIWQQVTIWLVIARSKFSKYPRVRSSRLGITKTWRMPVALTNSTPRTCQDLAQACKVANHILSLITEKAITTQQSRLSPLRKLKSFRFRCSLEDNQV